MQGATAAPSEGHQRSVASYSVLAAAEQDPLLLLKKFSSEGWGTEPVIPRKQQRVKPESGGSVQTKSERRPSPSPLQGLQVSTKKKQLDVKQCLKKITPHL